MTPARRAVPAAAAFTLLVACGLALSTCGADGGAAAGHLPGAGGAPRLPLGPENLVTRAGEVVEIAPGVTVQEFSHGRPGDSPWAVSVRLPSGSATTAEEAEARRTAEELTAGGFPARVRPVVAPATDDLPGRVVAYAVQVGRYERKADALAAERRLAAIGRPGRTYHVAEDGGETTGPWHVTVVSVRPGAAATLGTAHGADLSGAETVLEMARAAGALAAVNGNEFDVPGGRNFSGFPGEPQGLYVRDGSVLSEAANGRTAFVTDAVTGRSRITEVTTSSVVTSSDGAVREVDGFDRVPGRIPGCGGVGGDVSASDGRPVQRPWRNELCVDPGEIVVFDDSWGANVPAGRPENAGGVEVVLTGDGRVIDSREPAGGPIPRGGRVLGGIGDGALWLREHAPVGALLTITTRVTDAAGAPLAGPGLSAIAGGGPALVRDGRVFVNTGANGITDARGLANDVPAERHPRTLAGVTADGTVLLVVIDGRAADRSVGATLRESAAVMRHLGAVDAMGLGSGGDTTLVVGDEVRNTPMAGWGDRPTQRQVSTALVVLPSRRSP